MSEKKILIRQGRLTYAISHAICNGFLDEDENHPNCIYHIYESSEKKYTIKIAKSPKVMETGLLQKKYNKIYAPEELIKVTDLLFKGENYQDKTSLTTYQDLKDMMGVYNNSRNTQKIKNLLTLVGNIKLDYIDNKGSPRNKKLLNSLELNRYSVNYEINEDVKEITQNYFYLDKVAFSKDYYSIYRAIKYNKEVNKNKPNRKNNEISIQQLIQNFQSLSYETMKKNKNRHYYRDIQKPIMTALEDIKQDNILFDSWYYEGDSPPLIKKENKLYIPELKDLNKKDPPFQEWRQKKILFIYK